MMEESGLIEMFESLGVIPVIAIESSSLALPLADALIEGGLPVAEITFRTQAAAQVIKTLKKERPHLLLGAGTLLTLDNLLEAKACGAAFGVAPGLNPVLVDKAQEIGFPFFPGVMTPSEIDRALSLKRRVLKFFPSEAGGGLTMLKAVSGPFSHTGVRFIPTGGINRENLAAYLGHKAVIAVGGTWIATKDMISSEKWDLVKANAQEAVGSVSSIRGKPNP